MSSVVIVESPAKAKTINKYLGSDYTVLASYGHVRDLPAKDGSVRPDDDFSMDWEVDERARKHMREISKALKGASHLFLATDPDREGEAISWHVRELLDQDKSLSGIEVKRVVFNEITKTAILEAFKHPRDVDNELVEAYLARRALDYLVGFTLSPVLWRKLPGSRSAGRVQSVALRLICVRETDIENFNSEEYWTVKADLKTVGGAPFEASLTRLNGEKLEKMSLGDEAAATAAVAAIESREFSVGKVDRKQARRNPSPPFTTSTLQQEASRKLRLSTRQTMQVAQRLYEGINLGGETVGLITYMRTDGVQISNEAIGAARSLIGSQYGPEYVPATPRAYKTKAKNAQEAHEAIRPTDMFRKPEDVADKLDAEQLKLYTLIWKRAIASQMESAVLDQVAVDLVAPDGGATLRATGSVIAFDGFYRLYREGKDDSEVAGDDRILPAINEGEAVKRETVTPEQHFTQPPPRFTEASLVKTMEELGIGRPSTYASIISVLQERDYVKLESRRFTPEDRGRVVIAFLENFFSRYVEYNFTAELEAKLDDISGGRIDWKTVLREFWDAFNEAVGETKDLRITEVLDKLDADLGPHFFRDLGDGRDPRKCRSCDDGRLNLKIGKFGAFIGCSNYPECRFTTPLAVNTESGGDDDVGLNGPKELGTDPVSSLAVTLRKGPYGHYVQLGEPEGTGKTAVKPKRSSLPKTMPPASVDLEKALGLLSLPRDVGIHPETNEMITAAIGRFGPYIKLGGAFLSLKGDDDVLTIGLNRAVHLLASAPRKDPPRELGNHPKDGKPVTIKDGRYGPYVQHGRLMATLPKGTEKDDVTLELALARLTEKAAKGGKGAKAAKAAKPAKAKKPAKKKPAKKKPAKAKAKPAAAKT